jgi:hypothetical protein
MVFNPPSDASIARNLLYEIPADALSPVSALMVARNLNGDVRQIGPTGGDPYRELSTKGRRWAAADLDADGEACDAPCAQALFATRSSMSGLAETYLRHPSDLACD